MDLHAQRLDVVGAVRAPCEVRQVELNLVPALIETHGHCADERLDARCALVVRRAKPPAHVLVVENHHLEGEVLLHILDDHDEVRQLDAKGLLRVRRARQVARGDVSAHDFEHAAVNVGIFEAFDVPVPHLLVPDLQRLAANRVQNRQEARLESVFEHTAQ